MDKSNSQLQLQRVAGANNYQEFIAYFEEVINELSDVRNTQVQLLDVSQRIEIVDFLTNKINEIKRTRKQMLAEKNQGEDFE